MPSETAAGRAETIATAGFLSEFLRRHQQMRDRPFCWVLGSGASVQSGIPSGGTLAKQWLEELHELEDLDNQPLEKWATEANLGIKGFDLKAAANFYPYLYQRRFRDYRDAGYAFLENAMDAAEPSYGYSVLAQIMSATQHKVAVTTNFDNLIPDAISIYARVSTLVCGHESLTGFIRPNMTRPVVAKIHRDLLLNPKNEPEEIEMLPEEWSEALRVIFTHNTPIVIGYGGNDGSLMEFFRKSSPIKGGMFWCHRIGSAPDQRIQEIINHHRGRLVPILGFDELMLQLWQKLCLESPIPELQRCHEQRLANYQKQLEDLNSKLKKRGESKAEEKELEQIRPAAAAAVDRIKETGSWWAWAFRAESETDPSKAEQIFREALKEFPNHPELKKRFAEFLEKRKRNDG